MVGARGLEPVALWCERVSGLTLTDWRGLMLPCFAPMVEEQKALEGAEAVN
jgi:hypothetical protein